LNDATADGILSLPNALGRHDRESDLSEQSWQTNPTRGVSTSKANWRIFARSSRTSRRRGKRIRSIIGTIGGVPKTQARLINILFIAIVGISVLLSILGGRDWQLPMIEVATVTLSIKITYLIHSQMRVAHFVFWILSSLEWRINEIMRQLREIRKQTEGE